MTCVALNRNPMSTPTAEAAEAHLRRRAQIVKHLARLATLLSQWHIWEADQHLPPAERTMSRPPEGSRDALQAVHHALFCELHDLDAPIVRERHEPEPVPA